MITRWQRRWHDYWASFTHREQIAATIAGGLVLLGVLCWPVFRFWAAPKLHDWRVQRTMRQASAYDAAQDYRNLLLSIRRASQLGSNDVQVWKNIAGYLTKLGDPQAISARETVLTLAPEDISARIELAQTALLFGNLAKTQEALQATDTAYRSNENYERASATLALYLGDVDALKSHLAKLIATRPDEVDAHFNLAAAQVWSLDPTERALGVDQFKRLLGVPRLRVSCALELLKHAARAQDGPLLNDLMPLLITELDFPTQSGTPRIDFPALILGLKHTALASAADVALVARWLSEVRLGADALQWIHSLPPTLSENPSVREVAAEIAFQEDLPAATSFYLLENAFGDLPPEAAVLAVGARQLEASMRLSAAQAAWDEAVELAAEARHPDGLRVLARLASIWGKSDWAEKSLRTVIKRSPNAFWAYAALRDQLIGRDAANETWSLYQEWVARQPDDLSVISQWIRLGSSLPFTRDEVCRRAPSLLRTLPESPGRDAAHAGLLWLNGDIEAALAAVEELQSAAHHDPDVAFWAALVTAPTDPNRTYPALARLPLLSPERDRLKADKGLEVGLPRSTRASAAPSLTVR